jgi:hypothetical protein
MMGEYTGLKEKSGSEYHQEINVKRRKSKIESDGT